MRVIAKTNFTDLNLDRWITENEEYETTDERADYLSALGLVEKCFISKEEADDLTEDKSNDLTDDKSNELIEDKSNELTQEETSKNKKNK